MPSLAQCEMCENGLANHEETVDGDAVHLCTSCYRLLEESGRIEGPEVPA